MRSNRLDVLVHFVWATWDRQALITEDIERQLYRCIETISEKRGCPVLAIGGMPDHVHLLVSLSNTITIADLMEFVKGSSSRFVDEKLKPGEWFKWQGHYGALSVSPRDKRKVIDYINKQKQHHADGTIWPHAEETLLEIDASHAVVEFAPAKAGARPKAR